PRCGLAQVAGRAEVDGLDGALRYLGTEGEQGLVRGHFARLQAQRLARRVVAGELAGRVERGAGLWPLEGPYQPLDLLDRQAARPQQGGALAKQRDDGRLQADLGRPVV